MDYQLLPYRISLALLTDLYQLTMANGYWKNGVADREVVFNLFFRKHPFKGGYTLCAGLAAAMDLLEHFRFDEEDLGYMAGLLGRDGKPLFEPAFLNYLRNLKLACDIDAIPEGTVVFPQEPLVRVKGPILQAQILETFLTSSTTRRRISREASRSWTREIPPGACPWAGRRHARNCSCRCSAMAGGSIRVLLYPRSGTGRPPSWPSSQRDTSG